MLLPGPLIWHALVSSHWPQWPFRRVRILAPPIIAGLLTLTAVRSRPLPVDLAGRLDPTLSLSTVTQPSVQNRIQLPVASLADFAPLATRRASGPSRTKPQKNRASPYPRGKDEIQNLGSRPSDVGHTVATRHYRRYLIFVLSITRH